MMNELRTRIAFKAEDEDIQSSEVLGEQEQEEIIEDLRKESVRSKELHSTSFRILLILSSILQISFFFQNPRISNLMISMNLLVHINAILALTPSLSKAWTTPLGPVPGMPHARLSYTLAFSTCISTITLLLPRDRPLLWIDTVRYLETPAIIGLVLLGQCWIQEADEDIVQLERMQFPAKGA